MLQISSQQLCLVFIQLANEVEWKHVALYRRWPRKPGHTSTICSKRLLATVPPVPVQPSAQHGVPEFAYAVMVVCCPAGFQELAIAVQPQKQIHLQHVAIGVSVDGEQPCSMLGLLGNTMAWLASGELKATPATQGQPWSQLAYVLECTPAYLRQTAVQPRFFAATLHRTYKNTADRNMLDQPQTTQGQKVALPPRTGLIVDFSVFDSPAQVWPQVGIVELVMDVCLAAGLA